MSGPESLRGFDYQVCVALHRLLEIIKKNSLLISCVKFDSLSEDEEDLSIKYSNGRIEQFQVKKKAEGYHWTPSELREIFISFLKKDASNIRFQFVSDRGGNPDVVKLKRQLKSIANATDEDIKPFTGTKLSLNELKKILPKVELITQFYPSPNDDDPAASLRREIVSIIARPPFLTKKPVKDVETLLWKRVYDWSRQSSEVTNPELMQAFSECGLYFYEPGWANPPPLPETGIRKKESAALKCILEKNNTVTVLGISGTGKSSLLSLVTSELVTDNYIAAWFAITSLMTSNDLANQFMHFISLKFDSDFLGAVDGFSLQDRATTLGMKLAQCKAILVIDGLEKGNSSICDFVEAVLSNIAVTDNALCRIIVSTIILPTSWIPHPSMKTFELRGFTYEDAKLFLNHFNIQLSEEDSKDIWAILGGHPLSFSLFKEFSKQCGNGQSLMGEIKSKTVQKAREYLFEKVLSNLPKEQCQALLAVSIFNYPFNVDEATSVLDNADFHPRIELRELMRRGLVVNQGGTFSIHDAVRGMAYHELSDSKRTALHGLAAKWYENEMRRERQGGSGALYETIIKWGGHVEFACNQSVQTPSIQQLLDLSREQLDVLWAIQRFHYPFSFTEGESGNLSKILQELSLLGWLKHCPDVAGCKMDSMNEDSIKKGCVESTGAKLRGSIIDDAEHYTNEDADENETLPELAICSKGEFDCEFIAYLCINREISGSIGYIQVFKPNEHWEEQGLICQWEHCIECQPLPPITRSSYEMHLNFLKEQFDEHGYKDKPEEIREMLRQQLVNGIPEDAVEEVDIDQRAAACPLFGHICPGGKEQANECREQTDDLD